MTDDPTNAAIPPVGEPKPPEQTPAEPKPPEPPKYAPPPGDMSIIDKQVEYYKRNAASGGKDLDELISKLASAGVLDTGDPAPSSNNTDVAELRIEIAKERAARRFGLNDEDIKMLKGTPDEILAGAEYLSKRISATPPADANPAPPVGDGETPPAKPPEKKPDAPAFEHYATRPDDPQEFIRQAEAAEAESRAAGGKLGVRSE